MNRIRGPLATLLSLSLLSPAGSLPAQTAPAAPIPTAPPAKPDHAGELQGDLRILHALNRFTFGPRPGDLEAVRAVGLEKWFDRQLHPESLPEPGLFARLAQFPAMQGSTAALLVELPSGAMIRLAADGKVPVPAAGISHAVYENEIARYQQRQTQKEVKKPDAASAVPAQHGKPAAAANAGMAEGAATMDVAMVGAPAMGADATRAGSGLLLDGTGSGAMAPKADAAMTLEKPRVAAKTSTPEEDQIARILALPQQERLARLAAMTPREFERFHAALKPAQREMLTSGMTPTQKEMLGALDNPQRVVADELASQRLVRDIYSNAQLQEVMTDFWLNHFNVYLHKNEETPYYLVSYERDVIRPRALGKFEDLLEATAHSPAMLLYLDNSSSTGPDSQVAERSKKAALRRIGAPQKAPEGLNENYARELMELHTLGVNGGYKQADVPQVARVLTGWTVDHPQKGGDFKFDDNRHEPGVKKVMGKKIKENGELEGRELLHLLAMRPATAQFLSRKLAVRFVGDDPPKSLVDRMAKSYKKSGGDIATVLTTLFHSPEFWATDSYRAKVKTPLEFVVSAARATNASTDNLQPLLNALRDMGMPLYGAVPPTGYNWNASEWVNTGALVNRMNFALSLAANRLPGINVAWSAPETTAGAAMPGLATSPESASRQVPDPAGEERRLESLLVTGGLDDSTRQAVLGQFEAQKKPGGARVPVTALNAAQTVSAQERQDQLLAGLLLGSPEFQRR